MIISRTPLRISFAGGGTDLEGYYGRNAPYGAVVSSAINWYIYITANKKFDDDIRISYSKTEIVANVDEIEHNIIREALRIVGIEKGIEIVYMADIPLAAAGSGLGSSSSLAVGVLNALYAYKGIHVSAERLAREACQIEIETLKHPIGKQDQYIAAYGGLNYMRFNRDGSVFVDPVICSPATKQAINKNIMLFYTGIQRYSSEILEDQRGAIIERLDYHHRLVALADEMREHICNDEAFTMGELLHEGWENKKHLAANVSNSEIDNWYDKARKAGALGGKIAGAGGGGFLMLYCEEEKQNDVRDALSDLKMCPVELEPQGSKIVYVAD